MVAVEQSARAEPGGCTQTKVLLIVTSVSSSPTHVTARSSAHLVADSLCTAAQHEAPSASDTTCTVSSETRDSQTYARD